MPSQHELSTLIQPAPALKLTRFQLCAFGARDKLLVKKVTRPLAEEVAQTNGAYRNMGAGGYSCAGIINQTVRCYATVVS